MQMNKRTKVLAGGIALAVFGGGAAYAYWTAGGSGTGTAATDTTVPLTVNQTGTLTPMYPGDTPQPLSGTFGNSNDGPIYVGTVTATIASVTKAGGAPAGTCDASDYVLSDAAMTVNAQVPAGAGVGSWSGATIQFKNKVDDPLTTLTDEGGNQDGCKGATVNLAYAVS